MAVNENKSPAGYTRGEWSTKPDYEAECQTCGWRLNSKNAQGPAAVHARSRKHCVRVEVAVVRIYNHEP